MGQAANLEDRDAYYDTQDQKYSSLSVSWLYHLFPIVIFSYLSLPFNRHSPSILPPSLRSQSEAKSTMLPVSSLASSNKRRMALFPFIRPFSMPRMPPVSNLGSASHP